MTDPGLNAFLTPLSPENPLAGMRIVHHFRTRKPKPRKVTHLSTGTQLGRDGLGLGPDWPPKATLLAPTAPPEEAKPFNTLAFTYEFGSHVSPSQNVLPCLGKKKLLFLTGC